MTDPAAEKNISSKIIDIKLDRHSLSTRSTELEIERHKAMSDLLHDSQFQLLAPGVAGPYRLRMELQDDKMLIHVLCASSGYTETLRLPLAALKKNISDYALLCDNFYKTARSGQIHKLEAIDAGRRGLHDELALNLSETLEKQAKFDKATARRLFTLLYVLYMRNTTHL